MSTENQKIGDGKFVAFSYRLTNAADGTLLFEAKPTAPDVMIYGVTQEIIPGLIAAIKGLSAGDKFSVTLPPEAAFGHRMEENVMDLDREIFVRDGELAEEVVVDAELPMMTQEGFTIKGKILEITDQYVRMDFNHPFSDMTVQYDGEIVEVRDATTEELNPHHGCGCGCSCGDGGCSDSCGCGDGCDCGC